MQPLSVSTRSRVAGRLHVPLAAAALALVALSCGAPPAIVGPSATPTATAATGVSEVVFAASLADNQELYLADPATGRLTRLTHDPARFRSPTQFVPERAFVTGGLSKDVALGGWRIGFARMPDGPTERPRVLHAPLHHERRPEVRQALGIVGIQLRGAPQALESGGRLPRRE